MEIIRIAVDGPSGAGKSTIAKEIAKELSIDYIDSGAMYRAIGYKMVERGIALDDEKGVTDLLEDTKIDFKEGSIYLDDEDISNEIRTPLISRMASDCSKLFAVREKLVELQRKMGEEKSVIMDGRDIGTNVFPDAEFKFYITATVEERARRRYLELQEKGDYQTLEEVLKDMEQRDYNDSTRELNPLVKAQDAVLVDTTDMTIEEVKDYILGEINDYHKAF